MENVQESKSPKREGSGAVWILRHGERLDKVDESWAKSASRPYDPPLTPDGHVQGVNFAAIYSSPFLRCLQTANEVADEYDLPIHVELGASEWVCRSWTPGLVGPLQHVIDIDKIITQFPRVARDYYPHKSFIKEVKNPETRKEVSHRYLTTLRQKSGEHEEEDILVVSHGQMFWETQAVWLKQDMYKFKLQYAAIAGFERHGESWRCIEDMHNSHWEGTMHSLPSRPKV